MRLKLHRQISVFEGSEDTPLFLVGGASARLLFTFLILPVIQIVFPHVLNSKLGLRLARSAHVCLVVDIRIQSKANRS